MSSGLLAGRIALLVGGAAVVGMAALSACSPSSEKDAPSPSTTTTPPATSAPSASPTEKAVGGPDYSDSFTPSINPTPPGAVCKEIVNGVCVSR